jgi:hypothetical protein
LIRFLDIDINPHILVFDMPKKPENSERKYFYLSAFFSILFFLKALIFPSLDPSGGMDFGFGISAILLFLSMFSFVSAYAFFVRSRLVDDFYAGKDVLLHITYSATEWKKHLEVEERFEGSEKRGMLIILYLFSLIFSIMFLLMDPEAGVFVAGVLFSVCVGLTILVIFIMPLFRKKSSGISDPQAYVSKKGVLVGKTLHNWNLPLSGFSKARLIEKKGESFIQFDYFYLSPKAGVVPVRFLMYVPKKDVQKAREALKKMG